ARRTWARTSDTAQVLAAVATMLMSQGPAVAADAAVDRDVAAALSVLLDTTPSAKNIAGQAKGVLIFPNIVKAGFLVGAQYGEGALLKDGKTTAYYNIAAASYGFQAGAQSFAYALFFMTPAALDYLDKSGRFEVRLGP